MGKYLHLCHQQKMKIFEEFILKTPQGILEMLNIEKNRLQKKSFDTEEMGTQSH